MAGGSKKGSPIVQISLSTVFKKGKRIVVHMSEMCILHTVRILINNAKRPAVEPRFFCIILHIGHLL